MIDNIGGTEDGVQFDPVNGICKWCGALPGGEHAPDCRPPDFTVKDPAYIKNTDDFNEWSNRRNEGK